MEVSLGDEPESGRARTRRSHPKVPTPKTRDLFHPDCDRRPWLRTRSADPAEPTRGTAGARGLPRRGTDTAGGEFHPALRTPSAPQEPTRAFYRPRPRACSPGAITAGGVHGRAGFD